VQQQQASIAKEKQQCGQSSNNSNRLVEKQLDPAPQ